MIDGAATVERLRERIATVDRRRDPHEHATLAYRLGLAHAEATSGEPQENLRTALQWYDRALEGFDAVYDPVPHARVLNAVGAALRSLGRLPDAIARFEKASTLLQGRGRDDELAACLNNLGLARSGLGDIDGALDAFDRAIEVFSNSSEEGRRGRAATLVNKGMLLSSTGTAEALARAVETFASATEAVAGDEAPYHSAMADHARGVAEMDLAAVDHNERDTHLRRAVRAFEESLAFFTRTGFPYQHSLAKHNLGRALLGLGGEGSALSALVAVEDAVAVLDPRIHRTEWEHALASLGEIETALAEVHPGVSRRGLFVVLFESSDRDERAALLVNRLTRVLALPPDARHSALRELAAASLRATDDGLAYIGIELTVLTELPNEHLESALRARLAAHGELDGERREAADRALDQAVGDALNGPQRVFVRDFLAANGFERP